MQKMTINLEAIYDRYVHDQLVEFINDCISEQTGYGVEGFYCTLNIDYELDTSDDGNEHENLVEAVFNGPDFNREES